MGVTEETVISSIVFPQGRVDFNYESTSRQDLPGSLALDNIEIYKNNTLFKTFNLVQGYFVADSSTDAWPQYGDFNTRSKRLRLDKVQEKDALGNVLPSYQFHYNTNVNLPSRFSNGQDFWGYYNGQDNNDEFIPATRVVDNIYRYTDNNRRVNTSTNQANILTKITYPTGGETEYFYESNMAKKDRVSTMFNPFPDYNLGGSVNSIVSSNLFMDKSSSSIDPSEPLPTYVAEISSSINRVWQILFGVSAMGIIFYGADNILTTGTCI
jgi:hypothetical protein